MIKASAPVRICDNGGWTDTWFGGPGRVLTSPSPPESTSRSARHPALNVVVIDAVAFGDRYPIVPGASRVTRDPLPEGAVDAFPPPPDTSVEICVRSSIPAGCGTGTSATVAVALLGALAAARGGGMGGTDLAYAADRLEVDVLRAETGIQDQMSATFGGINYPRDRYLSRDRRAPLARTGTHWTRC